MVLTTARLLQGGETASGSLIIIVPHWSVLDGSTVLSNLLCCLVEGICHIQVVHYIHGISTTLHTSLNPLLLMGNDQLEDV